MMGRIVDQFSLVQCCAFCESRQFSSPDSRLTIVGEAGAHSLAPLGLRLRSSGCLVRGLLRAYHGLTRPSFSRAPVLKPYSIYTYIALVHNLQIPIHGLSCIVRGAGLPGVRGTVLPGHVTVLDRQISQNNGICSKNERSPGHCFGHFGGPGLAFQGVASQWPPRFPRQFRIFM